jgi:cytoskeletal protein RodZ
MQLDELIDRYAIQGISERTNISENVIDKLHNREFAKLKKTQALGAISIIEREFQVDLSPLRQECKNYFGENEPPEIGLAVAQPANKEKRSYARALSILLLLLLASGAWYFFAEYYQQKVEPVEIQRSGGLADNAVIDENDTLPEEEQKSEKTAKSEKPASSKAKSEEKSLKIADVSGVKTPELTDEARKQTPAKAEASEPLKQEEHTLAESLKSELGEIEAMAQSLESEGAEASTQEKPAEKQNAEQAAPATQPESATQEVGTQTVAEASESEEETAQPAKSVRKAIILLPERRMWFRLVDLNTKKSREYKRKDRYVIDLKGHNWLFATQNAAFSIIDGDTLTDYASKGKLFFRFDQNGVHQLSEAQYRAQVR